MRITNQMISDNFMNDMMQNLANLKDLDSQLTSGKEFKKPSDNPFKVSRSMQIYTEIYTGKQFKQNIKQTTNWLDTTDTTLSQAGDALQRIRELLVAAGNATYGSNERKAINDEINQKINQFGQILNTNFDGKYIFGGNRVNTKPIETINPTKLNINYEIKDPAAAGIVNTAKNSFKIEGKFTENSNGVFDVKAHVDKATNEVSFEVTKKINGKPDEKMDIIKTGKKSNEKIEVALIDDLKMTVDGTTDLIQDESEYSQSVNTNSFKIYNSFTGSSDATYSVKTVVDADNNVSFDVTKKVTGKPDEQMTIKTGKKNNERIEANLMDGLTVTIDGRTNLIKDGIEYTADAKMGKATENSSLAYYIQDKTNETNELNMITKKLQTQISVGVTIEYNVTVKQIMEFTDDSETKNLFNIFSDIVKHLDDPDGVFMIQNDDLKNIKSALSNILTIRSEVGAKQNRMDSAEKINTDQDFNLTEILSQNEDIDFTEKNMEFAMAQAVYIASLQTSARILQPSLMDYLR